MQLELPQRESIVTRAKAALLAGEPILIYDDDGREAETDIVYASVHVDDEAVRRLRRDGGGLVCATVAPRVHRKLGLPWLSQALDEATAKHPILRGLLDADVPYEDASNQRPSFGLTVNHRDTFTGIPDAERAHTIRRLALLSQDVLTLAPEVAAARFVSEFKTPGHVHLLNVHPEGIRGRQGHTELATALIEAAGLPPSATLCEMVGGTGGRAAGPERTQRYADDRGLCFLSGADILAELGAPAGR